MTTTVEETTTTYEVPDHSANKKKKVTPDNTLKSDFDLSARRYIDWIDSIERILHEKSWNALNTPQQQNIIEVK